MADVRCAQCGEPWDVYEGRADMEPAEFSRFRKGEGCPCCGFGERCPTCDGTGRTESFGFIAATSECQWGCRGRGYTMAWRVNRVPPSGPVYQPGIYYTGWQPSVKKMPESTGETPLVLGVRRFPEKIRNHPNGSGSEWWVPCPDGCRTTDTCPRCEGSGKLQRNPEHEIRAAAEMMEALDGDPIEVLIERGLL